MHEPKARIVGFEPEDCVTLRGNGNRVFHNVAFRRIPGRQESRYSLEQLHGHWPIWVLAHVHHEQLEAMQVKRVVECADC